MFSGLSFKNLGEIRDNLKSVRDSWEKTKFRDPPGESWRVGYYVIGKYVKIRFKNRESPCYFLSSRGQKIKNITKTEQTRLFSFTFLVSFFMAFLAQKLIHTINIIFNSVLSLFFEQNHLSNLIIFGVYSKRWPKFARISK